VLVYARDLGEGSKHDRALAWVEHLWKARSGRLSNQVLQEYYVTVTRKAPAPAFRPPRPVPTCVISWPWRPVTVEADLLETAWRLEARSEVSFWEGLVVAAARSAGCTHLLTEDLAEGRRLGGVTVASPFMHEPGSLDR